MNLQDRKQLMIRLGEYMKSKEEDWSYTKTKAHIENNWFIPEFIELAVSNIANQFLQEESLTQLIQQYHLPQENPNPKKVGIVMAGNIPLVGVHDLLCVFLSGNIAVIKLSSKDTALLKHLVGKLTEWNSETGNYIQMADLLRGCDAYIATGSNNSGRYFEYYFSKYPHIIRKNRTSVAILTGEETAEELSKLADDVYQYFGLGCRNVTKLFVPEGYDFVPLLEAFKKYDYLINHNKYKNNYDHNLAMHILNNKYYMTNGSILLVEAESPFSPISQVHYEFYKNKEEVQQKLQGNESVQCIVSRDAVQFGQAQIPDVCTFADKVDTMDFLNSLR